ncbi:hypothetical protein BC833DRAFT_571697 [Globomyces pollinis-pini]|nr:hypothetical protein BC833DRAFT_571697 [Globomyces pollinis-pini]KAJ2993677.1 hypothetical protein HDV02_002171 [Globomyces sp. JEL0801]
MSPSKSLFYSQLEVLDTVDRSIFEDMEPELKELLKKYPDHVDNIKTYYDLKHNNQDIQYPEMDSEVIESVLASEYAESRNDTNTIESLIDAEFDDHSKQLYLDCYVPSENVSLDNHMEYTLDVMNTLDQPKYQRTAISVSDKMKPISNEATNAIEGSLFDENAIPSNDIAHFKNFLKTMVSELQSSPASLQKMSEKVGKMYNPLTGTITGDDYFMRILAETSKKGGQSKARHVVRKAIQRFVRSGELTKKEQKLFQTVLKMAAGVFEGEKESQRPDLVSETLNTLGLPQTLSKL